MSPAAAAALLPLANHSSDHWAVNVLLFLAPVVALGVLLWVWNRRGAEPSRSDAETAERHADDGRG